MMPMTQCILCIVLMLTVWVASKEKKSQPNAQAAAPISSAVSSTKERLWQNVWQGQSIDCNRTNWMHTAKTGSTFCLALQHVCCPAQWQQLTSGITMDKLKVAMASPKNRAKSEYRFESHFCYKFTRRGHPPLNCSFAGRAEHIPLNPDISLTNKMGIMIVREPKSRLISAFLDGVHLDGFDDYAAGSKLRTLILNMDRNKSLRRQERLLMQAQIYANQSVLYGHQVKMLLGGFGLDLSVRNETMMLQLVDRAVQRMRQFFFVGVFEQYTRSLQLFHELAHKGTKPTAVEMFPQRSTNAIDKAFLMKHLVFDDPYDTLLHQAAQKMFQEQLDYVMQWKNVAIPV